MPTTGTTPGRNATKSAQSERKGTCQDLLHCTGGKRRGTGTARLFAEGGRAAREDPQGTYEKSRIVRKLDYFCSHSWSCPRALKLCGLLVHFNLHDAVIATTVFHTVAFALELFFNDSEWARPLVMPAQRPNDLKLCETCRTGLLCQAVGPLVFCFFLCFSHVFRRTTSLFLDICCICQRSPHYLG